MKKVTLQEIANSLGISRTTVWKVFSGHEGVSDSLRNKVIAKAQELGYAIPEDFPYTGTAADSQAPDSIAVAVCRPETSLFWMTIIHQIAKVFSSHNINLVYTYLPSEADQNYFLPPALTAGNVKGIVVLNVYNERLLRLLAASPLPKVFLDTTSSVSPSELNGDLLLMENRSSIRQITTHLLETGKKHLGFIGDIAYAKSNQERYEGFCQALLDAGKKPETSLCLTTPLGINSYHEEIDAFLSSLSHIPDAFVCASDYVACILIRLLEKRGLCVPEDIAVSGFDNNKDDLLAETLTTVHSFNEVLGSRLALQILYRIQYPQNPYEITYLSTQVLFRASTGDTPEHI